jgi:hypothetical protein
MNTDLKESVIIRFIRSNPWLIIVNSRPVYCNRGGYSVSCLYSGMRRSPIALVGGIREKECMETRGRNDETVSPP